ncbi:hypothetical protein [Oleiphilus messinensis]|nr:hypothetical protein [Oleiphilus messinensis]
MLSTQGQYIALFQPQPLFYSTRYFYQNVNFGKKGTGIFKGKIIKVVFLALFSLLTIGCSIQKVIVNSPGLQESLEQSENLQIKDLRPEAEKDREIFSLFILSEAYGTSRQGDMTEPPPLRILQHRIYDKYVNEARLPEVKVYHFVTYMNMQAELRKLSTSIALNQITGLAFPLPRRFGVEGTATHVSQSEFEQVKDEYSRALYSETENPKRASVLIVYLDAEIDGERTFIKTMTPILLENQPGKIPIVVAIETAIAYFLDQYPKNEVAVSK